MPHRPDQTAYEGLLAALREAQYDFVAVTPATHARVIARRGQAEDLRDVFGWSLPFREALLPEPLFELLDQAEAVERMEGGLCKSRLRAARVGERLFLHSAFPTDEEDAVFFGPDTYRFIDLLRAELPLLGPVRRLVDVGAGSGAGGIVAGSLLPGAQMTLADVNSRALALAGANARAAGVEGEIVQGAGPEAIQGPVDLVIANPPYIIDESGRTYRHGGGMHGAELSLDWALAAARRLEPGGHMLLYTGVAIVGGRDALKEALEAKLPPLGCSLRYREIDPDIFGEELEKPGYAEVERIAAIGAVIAKG